MHKFFIFFKNENIVHTTYAYLTFFGNLAYIKTRFNCFNFTVELLQIELQAEVEAHGKGFPADKSPGNHRDCFHIECMFENV